MASWNLRNAVKFRDTPPTWDIFLTQWPCILARWYKHPAPTLPTPVSNHLVWYRTGLRCSAARITLNNVVMTMRL